MSINTLDIKGLGAAAMSEALKLVDAGLKAMTSVAAKLGSISTRIDLQTDFVLKLSDSVEFGHRQARRRQHGRKSSKLSALQTQQQSPSSRCRSPTPRRRTSCRSSAAKCIAIYSDTIRQEIAPPRRDFRFDKSIACLKLAEAIDAGSQALAVKVNVRLTSLQSLFIATHRLEGPAGGMKPVRSLPAIPACPFSFVSRFDRWPTT